jgi:hypothetical protein
LKVSDTTYAVMRLPCDNLGTMRELHGVVNAEATQLPQLKQYALLFDKFHLLLRAHYLDLFSPTPESTRADLAFLESQGLLARLSIEEAMRLTLDAEPHKRALGAWDAADPDSIARYLSAGLNFSQGINSTPICRNYLPTTFTETTKAVSTNTVLHVAVHAMPIPTGNDSWQDILDFKAEMRDKQWHFRRFLHTMASKNLNEAEIRDDIEWSLNEYSKAMELHRLKSSTSFVDVFVITPLEIIENLVKFNWSKIANGALQVQKRKVELMEAEMKAPGRECAYVFDARKRFGPK